MYVYQMLTDIEHPANSHLTGLLIANVINMEILPEHTTDHLYNFEEEEEYSEKHKEMFTEALIRLEYSTFNSIRNIGGAYPTILFLFGMLVMMVVIAIALLVLQQLIPENERRKLKQVKKQFHHKFGKRLRFYSFLS